MNSVVLKKYTLLYQAFFKVKDSSASYNKVYLYLHRINWDQEEITKKVVIIDQLYAILELWSKNLKNENWRANLDGVNEYIEVLRNKEKLEVSQYDCEEILKQLEKN